ncbi:protein phosphatase 2C, putative [Entamoeba dispar SAW760]|uniref:Protein phosphatase 2C, putative n=1 Tax=Entamoeba dispar (strain ATCC PRA-260 / SAW760) TaxID=370354 RepID=B0EEJ3_ENTDS|nr:protein phosphatase 2C, putative [Entamoeba dispar SAW760]EDR27053.1 protein phosphatase 2C, putative [Entamoeba dispar SAW760]|eukprot:EDR27053.1 protein phosphatase 2C, putative [Entamoeba dispar SAW760]
MGSLLSVPVTEQQSGETKGDFLDCGYTSMQGWRRTMEDAHIVDVEFTCENGKKASFFGVFDGHGGDQVAEYCSKIYVETLLNTDAFKAGNYQQALIDTNIKIDEQMRTPAVNDLLKTLGSGSSNIYDGMFGDLVADGMGCTSVVILIIDNTIYCGNAGDSRSVMLKGDNVIPLSVDHKPSLQSEIDRITLAGGTIDNGRVNGNLNLTRTIGDLMYKRQSELPPQSQIISCYPDITQQAMDGTEKLIILACDGIWDVLTNEQCVEKVLEYLKQGNSLKETCEKIANDCLSKEPYSKPGWDNMTLLVVKFKSFNPQPDTTTVVASSQEKDEGSVTK